MTKQSSGEAVAKALDLLLQTQTFKQMYVHKVKALTQYKGSFEQFYDKYLDKFSKHK
jgi:hypothetical protein